jgi:hypothetical protein
MSVSALGATSAPTLRSTGAAGQAAGSALSESDQQVVNRLQARDRVVRAHESAHMAAGSGLITHGASFTYETGPDGKRYAVGGEVGIDVSQGRTPEETLARAEHLRAAALAPTDPSAQDRQVASQADRMAMEARMEMSSAEADGAAGGSRGALAYQAVAAAGVASGGRVDAWA